MHRIDHQTADISVPDQPKFRGPNAQAGVPATVVTPEFLNDVQEAIAQAVEAVGLDLTKGSGDDLLRAIAMICGGGNSALARHEANIAGATPLIGLSREESSRFVVTLSGERTADGVLVFAADMPGPRWVYNGCTGAFNVSARLSGQTNADAIPLPAGGWMALVSDGEKLAATTNWSQLADPEAGGEAGSQDYVNPGTYTFTVPAGITSVSVEVVGGGGGGGGHDSSFQDGPSGGDGGTSSFGTYCTATGGTGGGGASSAGASPGGVGIGGDTNLQGGSGSPYSTDGGDGTGGAPGGGGGGGGASPATTLGGAGGDYGGAGGGGDYGQDGEDGTIPGGGGGGVVWASGGAGGGVALRQVTVLAGQAINVTVGAGGDGGDGTHSANGGSGAAGRVKVTW